MPVNRLLETGPHLIFVWWHGARPEQPCKRTLRGTGRLSQSGPATACRITVTNVRKRASNWTLDTTASFSPLSAPADPTRLTRLKRVIGTKEKKRSSLWIEPTASTRMGPLTLRRSPFGRPATRRSLREAQRLRQPNRLVSFVETTAHLRTMDYHFCRVAISSPA